LIQGWKVQDDGEFLHLVNDVFSDNLDTEMLSLCENFLKFRENSLIFKLMGHLWGYMSKLNCVETSHVLSTELTDTLGKPPSSIPSSLLEEISDTEEDCIFVGSNVASAVDPKSISAKLVCDSPKVGFLNPSVKLKRLETTPFLISNKPRGGKGSKKFRSTLRKCSEIIPAAEGFRTDPCPSKVVPDPITLRFDVSRGMGKVVSIIPVNKCNDPIVGGVPCDPSIDFDPNHGPFDFDEIDQVGLGDEINCAIPTDCVLYND
jgi:hypothetical protein